MDKYSESDFHEFKINQEVFTTYKLDIDKIETFEDMKNFLDALGLTITMSNNISPKYVNVKNALKYMKVII